MNQIVKRGRGFAIRIAVLLFAVQSVQAAEPLNAIDGIAMDGFDVVAYFKQAGPRKGLKDYSVEYKGQLWYFSSPGNASDFKYNPEIYEPQFNGWCAFAMSEGHVAQVDFIEGWSLLDGKLYLNWNKPTHDRFLYEQSTRKSNAATNWPDVRSRLVNDSIEVHLHKDVPQTGITHPQQVED
jgi:hypothetical protein